MPKKSPLKAEVSLGTTKETLSQCTGEKHNTRPQKIENGSSRSADASSTHCKV